MADISPDREQESKEFDAATAGRPWMRWVKIAVAVIIGLVILLFLARFIHHELKSSSKKPAITVPTKQNSGAQTQTGQSPSGSGTQAPTTPPASGGKTAAGAQVPNTGPGSTLAIFLGASVLAALIHRRAIGRR